MKAHPLLLGLLLLAGGASASRVDRLTLDIERPIQPFVVEITEETDTTLRAAIRGSGAEIDLDGWIGVFWYGDEREGLALTNSAAAWGQMEWDLTASLLPTNGRYQAMVLGHRPGRTEEWGRGVLQVRLNPSLDSLPPEWGGAGGEAYIIATQALSAASSASALAQAATNAAGQAAHAAGLLEARAPNWDAAYEWGDHAGLYLGLPGWHTWLSTNTLATTSYVDQALSAIPPPLTDRIINERQMLDADLDIWDVRDVGDTNVLILAYGYNYAPGAPPVPIDTRYTLGSMQIGGVTVPAYISNDPDYHAIYRQGADWYLDLPGAGAHKLTPRAPGYGELLQFQYGGYELFNGVIPALLMFDRPRRPPLMVDRVALASELDGGDYVPRQGGTATNLTLAGWVAMPQSQPTNLVLRLVASNEFILVKEVLQ